MPGSLAKQSTTHFDHGDLIAPRSVSSGAPFPAEHATGIGGIQPSARRCTLIPPYSPLRSTDQSISIHRLQLEGAWMC